MFLTERCKACSAAQNEKAARSIMEGGLFETKAMPEHRPLAGF
ncbi:hypothetical protein [Ensifer sp. BR816]|nr:hypothetical protein [Ensifer sp. BR816]